MSFGDPKWGGPPAWGLAEVLTTPHHKNISCYEPFTKKAPGLILWYNLSNQKGT